MDHEGYMRRAIALCEEKMATGEGGYCATIIVKDGEVIGEGWNNVAENHDATGHCEINAIRDAGQRTGNWDLSGSTLYTTWEPCVMCAAAIWWARIDRVFYGNLLSTCLRPRRRHRRVGQGGRDCERAARPPLPAPPGRRDLRYVQGVVGQRGSPDALDGACTAETCAPYTGCRQQRKEVIQCLTIVNRDRRSSRAGSPPAMGPTADGDDAICGSRIDGEGPPQPGGPSNVTGT